MNTRRVLFNKFRMLTEKQKLYIRLNWPEETAKKLLEGCTVREYPWQLPATPLEVRDFVLKIKEKA